MENTSHFLVFMLDDKQFALPLDTVERVIHAVEITDLPEVPAIVRGIINYKGTILPVFDIRPRFHLSQREIQPEDQLIIVNTPERTVALLVDTVSGDIEKLSSDVVPPGSKFAGTSVQEGILKMENGIILIPDLSNILTRQEDRILLKAMKKNAKDSK